VFLYTNEITLNNKFNRSTNIIYDNEDCEHYLITQSTIDTLNTFFRLDYHNSIALIGSFGCGKSSLLLYINTLLSQNQESEKCVEILQQNDIRLYQAYKKFIDKKSFLKVKLVGEHTSFKTIFKDTFLKFNFLEKLNIYLNKNENFQLSKALELLDQDIKQTKYTDVLFSVDEFGKFIEYSLEHTNDNDVFELQTLAEYVNKKNNYKLIISLHKAFGEYIGKDLTISYSDWDKIQGRFESIVFKNDYFEILNIFKETLVLNQSKVIKKAQNIIDIICKKSMLNEDKNKNLFKNIVPIHPFSAIVISEIFTRYFQNQRTVFSFLFSSEPFAFQEFISKQRDDVSLYVLSDLYQYVAYLLKVYNILLPDKELWYLAEYRLVRYKSDKDKLKTELIQIVALIHTFKLANIIPTNKKYLLLALMGRYEPDEIEKSIDFLEKEGVFLFQEKTSSFSLIEEANIDINKELLSRLSKDSNLNLEKNLNKFIVNKEIVAKRYFSKYGNKKSFEKIYVDKTDIVFAEKFKIFLTPKDQNQLIEFSKKNIKSIFIPINNITKIEELSKKIEALRDIKDEFKSIVTFETKEIIDNMTNDYIVSLERLLNDNVINNIFIFNGNIYDHTDHQIQQFISDIIEKSYPDAPMINNYTLNHTVEKKGVNTTHIKKLFESIMKDSDKEYLGIEKYPAHKALYLSIIKPSGMHQQIDQQWKLCPPTQLNFNKVWKTLDTILVTKVSLEDILEILAKEPYGLDDVKALFVISLYILVNEEQMHIISENTYKYTLTLDLLMNMWKATKKYQLQKIVLNRYEKNLFKAYVQIATDLTEYSYSKDKVASIIKTLYTKFTLLPHFAKNTQKLSQEAISLRSALISMKDPKEAFFIMFPKALGYESIENISNDEFSNRFKRAFNEIALSYKKEIELLEQFISDIFHFDTRLFPYGNALIKLSEKLSSMDGLDMEIKTLLRSFNYANNFISFIDNISIVLINKKVEDCYDNDINILKDRLTIVANKILTKLELVDIATKDKDIRKISLASFETDLNRVVSIDKKKLDTIQDTTLRLKELIPSNYTNEERIFLIIQLLDEELKNESKNA